MGKKFFVLFFVFTLLFIKYSYSQEYKYEYTNGTYYAEYLVSGSSEDATLKINVAAIFVYETKKSEYIIGIGMEPTTEYYFDIVNNSFTVETESETFKYSPSPEHIAIDLTGFAFVVPFEDMKKFSEAKEVILKAVLIKQNDKEKKEIHFTINLNPDATSVFSDFYGFGVKNTK